MNDNRTGMSEERLLEIIAAYGADTEKWPANERALAEGLLRKTDLIETALRQEKELDALLSAAPDGEVTDKLLQSVLASAPAPAVPAPGFESSADERSLLSQIVDWVFGSQGARWSGIAQPVAFVVMAAAIGLGFGFVSSESSVETETVAMIDEVSGGLDALYGLEWE